MKTDHEILTQVDAPGVRTLLLNRPASANALSAELVDALHSAVDAAVSENVRTLVFRGNSRHFCAGFDMSSLEDESDAEILFRFCRLGLLLERMGALPCTTVAVIEGAAVGAGADLAVACDHRIGTKDATLKFPGAGFGAVLGVRRLADVTSQQTAIALVSQGERVAAEEALPLGLLTSVIAASNIDGAVQLLAQGMQRMPPGTSPELMRGVRTPDHGESLAQLVRSLAGRPGLKDRIKTYADSSLSRIKVDATTAGTEPAQANWSRP